MMCKSFCVDDGEATLSNLQDGECSLSGLNSSSHDPREELENLENFITRLEKKRFELKRKINRTYSPFIRMIPPEIIAKISGFTNTDFTIMGSLPAPILLSSVCSDWRRTVIGTPQLWSSIEVNLPSQTSVMTFTSFLRLAAFIDKWLARSGQLPLHISLRAGHETTDSMTLEKYRIIFKILDQYSSRWHSLDISATPTILSCLQPDHLPLLERLNITVPFSFYDSECVLTFPPSPAPRLKAVGIQAVGIQSFVYFTLSSFLDFRIQWNNVTHLSAESLTMHHCFKFLRLVPQLIHCNFHNVIVDTRINLPEYPIISPLTYLSLSYHRRSQGRFLDKVVLPSLKTLVLFYVSSMDPLMAFLERSVCSLHTLSLQHLNIKKVDSLTQLLQFLSPSLTELVISRPPKRPNKKYLSIITKIYTSQSAVVGNDFLPHLEIFGYSDAFVSKASKPFKLPSLPTRNYPKPAIPLRLAYIDLGTIIHQPIPQDILSVLQHLNEDGILNTPSMGPLNVLLSSALLR